MGVGEVELVEEPVFSCSALAAAEPVPAELSSDGGTGRSLWHP